MNSVTKLAVLAAAIATPSAVMAQDMAAEPFIGASVGYHDLGLEDEADDVSLDIDDSGLIYGVVAGVDFPLGESLFAGVEGNFHLGNGPIDKEYGASARLGFRGATGSKFYVRGGYQEVDFDVEGLTGFDLDDSDLGVDSSDGDYLVGVGAELPIGSARLRLNVDTISFDTLRGTAGVVFGF